MLNLLLTLTCLLRAALAADSITMPAEFDYEPGVALTGPTYFVIQKNAADGGNDSIALLQEYVEKELRQAGFRQAQNERAAHLQLGIWSISSKPTDKYEQDLKFFRSTKPLLGKHDPEVDKLLQKMEEEIARVKEQAKDLPPSRQLGVAGWVAEHGKRPRLLFRAALTFAKDQVKPEEHFYSWLMPLAKLRAKDAPKNPKKNPGCYPALGFETQGEGSSIVKSLIPEGSALKSGMQVGDVVLSINGFPYDALSAMGDRDYDERVYSGKLVKVRVRRGEREVTLSFPPKLHCL